MKGAGRIVKARPADLGATRMSESSDAEKFVQRFGLCFRESARYEESRPKSKYAGADHHDGKTKDKLVLALPRAVVLLVVQAQREHPRTCKEKLIKRPREDLRLQVGVLREIFVCYREVQDGS